MARMWKENRIADANAISSPMPKESCIPPSPPMQMTSTPMTETPAQTYTVTGVLYLRKNMAHSMGTMTTLVAVKTPRWKESCTPDT